MSVQLCMGTIYSDSGRIVNQNDCIEVDFGLFGCLVFDAIELEMFF